MKVCRFYKTYYGILNTSASHDVGTSTSSIANEEQQHV